MTDRRTDGQTTKATTICLHTYRSGWGVGVGGGGGGGVCVGGGGGAKRHHNKCLKQDKTFADAYRNIFLFKCLCLVNFQQSTF